MPTACLGRSRYVRRSEWNGWYGAFRLVIQNESSQEEAAEEEEDTQDMKDSALALVFGNCGTRPSSQDQAKESNEQAMTLLEGVLALFLHLLGRLGRGNLSLLLLRPGQLSGDTGSIGC